MTLVATAVWWGLACFPILTALDAQKNGIVFHTSSTRFNMNLPLPEEKKTRLLVDLYDSGSVCVSTYLLLS